MRHEYTRAEFREKADQRKEERALRDALRKVLDHAECGCAFTACAVWRARQMLRLPQEWEPDWSRPENKLYMRVGGSE